MLGIGCGSGARLGIKKVWDGNMLESLADEVASAEDTHSAMGR